ncbi:hypothetical protein NPIL_503041 [Nephila pilipes]|uniref:Uncharacterized protein n=1 Tax=Nephila pilipes TaxID=299642 RepID=A0A8X6P4L5_NEPPI|nr:hypothetical protein NPIL_503041 [Nephila pilipes]
MVTKSRSLPERNRQKTKMIPAQKLPSALITRAAGIFPRGFYVLDVLNGAKGNSKFRLRISMGMDLEKSNSSVFQLNEVSSVAFHVSKCHEY